MGSLSCIPFVYVFRKPLAFFFLPHVEELRTTLEVLLEFCSRDEETFLIGTFNLSFQVAAVRRAEFGTLDGLEFALSVLALHIELTNFRLNLCLLR